MCGDNVKPHDPTGGILQPHLDNMLKLCWLENMTYWDCIASCLYELSFRNINEEPSHVKWSLGGLIQMRLSNARSKMPDKSRYDYAMAWYKFNKIAEGGGE